MKSIRFKSSLFLLILTTLMSVGCQGMIYAWVFRDRKVVPHPTPLVQTILAKDPDGMKLLIKSGCNVNKSSDYHFDTRLDRVSPLYIAIHEYNAHHLSEKGSWRPDPRLEQCLELLLQSGANINHLEGINIGINIPLLQATNYCQPFTVERLCHYGADPNCKDSNQNTPLHYLANKTTDTQRIVQIIDSLLQHGANINSQNKDGETPLIMASYNLNPKLIDVLIHKEANLHLKDHFGRSPITAARFSIANLKEQKIWDANQELAANAVLQLLEQATALKSTSDNKNE